MKLSFQQGFTFIELMVVITLSALLILSATGMLINTLLSDGRVSSVQVVKENGDYAIGQMEFLLRNAIELQPNAGGVSCGSGMDEIAIRLIDNNMTVLTGVDDGNKIRIASNSAFLTSDTVNVSSGPTFNCRTSGDGLIQTVDVEFTLEIGENSDRELEQISQVFRTSVALRSY